MKRRLLIVGAGYTGLRLAERAVAQGWAVTATTRSADRSVALESAGIRAVQWNADDGLAGLPLDAECDVVYSVPPAGESDAALVASLAGSSRRFVYLSSASVYGDHDGAVIDEDTARNPTSTSGAARLAVEDALIAGGFDALIIRIVGIYGPGRTLDRYLAGGRYKLVDGGVKLTNRVHVDDLVEVIIAALERAPRGPRAYLAADGHPVQVRDLVAWLIEHRGIALPPEVSLADYRAERGDDAAERWANSYTASNRRIVEELGVELAYPTVFDGYRAIFG